MFEHIQNPHQIAIVIAVIIVSVFYREELEIAVAFLFAAIHLIIKKVRNKY